MELKTRWCIPALCAKAVTLAAACSVGGVLNDSRVSTVLEIQFALINLNFHIYVLYAIGDTLLFFN